MSKIQTWIITSAILFVAIAISYYLFIFLPSVKKAELRKQAFNECEKQRNTAFEALNITTLDSPLTENKKMELFKKMWPDKGVETCANRLLSQWGFK